MTLAFEDANSKLLDVVSLADVDAEERVDLSSVAILKLRFGRDLTLIPQYWRYWRFWSIFLVKTLRLRFGQAFEAEVWLGFWGWVLINLWFLINFWYELKAVSLMRALNPWVRFAFCNQQNQSGNAFGDIVIKNWYWQKIPSKLEVALPPKCGLGDGWWSGYPLDCYDY